MRFQAQHPQSGKASAIQQSLHQSACRFACLEQDLYIPKRPTRGSDSLPNWKEQSTVFRQSAKASDLGVLTLIPHRFTFSFKLTSLIVETISMVHFHIIPYISCPGPYSLTNLLNLTLHCIYCWLIIMTYTEVPKLIGK